MISSNSMHIATKLTETAGKIGGTPSARAWFAGGERVGYDPRGRAVVRAQSAVLRIEVPGAAVDLCFRHRQHNSVPWPNNIGPTLP